MRFFFADVTGMKTVAAVFSMAVVRPLPSSPLALFEKKWCSLSPFFPFYFFFRPSIQRDHWLFGGQRCKSSFCLITKTAFFQCRHSIFGENKHLSNAYESIKKSAKNAFAIFFFRFFP